ncbi:MAG: hypothetical protein E7348_00925 [Clostridiales bacterium]|nr:hypothetical protein [Clostridiales bacterium]
MKKKFLIATLVLCLCFPTLLSGCFAITAYNMVAETNSYDIKDDYDKIKIDTLTANVTFTHSNTTESMVFCNEFKSQKHVVEVVDGTLTITQEKNQEWYGQVLDYTKSYIVIHLNKIQYDSLELLGVHTDVDLRNSFKFNNVNIETDSGNVKWCADVLDTLSIKTQSGNVEIDSACINYASINNASGDVTLNDYTATSHTLVQIATGNLLVNTASLGLLNVKIETGDATINDLISSDLIIITITTGNLSLCRSDANELLLTTTTGNIFASLLSNKKVTVQTDSGQISIPENLEGDPCKAKTSTGDITIEIISHVE